MRRKSIVLLFALFSLPAFAMVEEKPMWLHVAGQFEFQWDIAGDQAKTLKQPNGQTIWEGSLLPAFLVEYETGKQHYIKATADINQIQAQDEDFKFLLKFNGFGTGELLVKKTDWGVSFEKFSIRWTAEPPKIISLYFGTSLVPKEGQSMMPAGQPFIGDWRAAGFCVPGTKEGPAQSYFRMWNFGQSIIPLGSFGPTLGAPYGAAFPRPVLAFAMGNDQGWTAFGAGSLPDAPMVLKLQSSMGCIQYLYREDLWGTGQKERIWRKPLRITFGENAWLAFRDYFHSFPEKAPLSNIHQKAIWNTWFRKTMQWEPVWLHSHVGGLTEPPQLKCWGRQEKINEKDELTALVLSAGNKELKELEPFDWEGRWALVSQNGDGILNTSQLAVIPFDVGVISIQLPEKPESVHKLSIDGDNPFTDWKWGNGKLTIRINESALSKTAGFRINRTN